MFICLERGFGMNYPITTRYVAMRLG